MLATLSKLHDVENVGIKALGPKQERAEALKFVALIFVVFVLKLIDILHGLNHIV